MTPKRIQRKRTSGWKMPENTVSVTRPGKWGNPFVVGDFIKIGNGKKAGEFGYIKAIHPKYATSGFRELKTIADVIASYTEYVTKYPPLNISELRGKDLACWCKPGQPCHADILLKIANS